MGADMEDYDQYMDERGHEACAQMLARNSAGDGAESLPALHISEDGRCVSVEVDLLEHARAVIARRIAETEQAAFDKALQDMGYVRVDGGTEGADMDGYLGELSRMRLEVELLRDENAELRKLLAETLMPYRDYAKKYGIAPYLADVNEHLDARMRELGVEVEQ